jgi:hypothetical protein
MLRLVIEFKRHSRLYQAKGQRHSSRKMLYVCTGLMVPAFYQARLKGKPVQHLGVIPGQFPLL